VETKSKKYESNDKENTSLKTLISKKHKSPLVLVFSIILFGLMADAEDF